MDAQRFDAMTRALSSGTSRRRVLRGLAAGAAGAVAGAVGLRRAGAGAPSVNCSAYGRVCTFTGCCTTGTCRCYANGHCRCVCPAGTSFGDGACLTPGGCPVTFVAGPPTQAILTAQDDSGVVSLVVTRSENADTVVPPFTPGTTEPITVTSTKIDQTKPARIELRVTTALGDVRACTITF